MQLATLTALAAGPRLGWTERPSINENSRQKPPQERRNHEFHGPLFLPEGVRANQAVPANETVPPNQAVPANQGLLGRLTVRHGDTGQPLVALSPLRIDWGWRWWLPSFSSVVYRMNPAGLETRTPSSLLGDDFLFSLSLLHTPIHVFFVAYTSNQFDAVPRGLETFSPVAYTVESSPGPFCIGEWRQEADDKRYVTFEFAVSSNGVPPWWTQAQQWAKGLYEFAQSQDGCYVFLEMKLYVTPAGRDNDRTFLITVPLEVHTRFQGSPTSRRAPAAFDFSKVEHDKSYFVIPDAGACGSLFSILSSIFRSVFSWLPRGSW